MNISETSAALRGELDVPSRPPTATLGQRLASLRYVPADARDLRVDMLRGLAIVVMVANHLSARSYINAITQGRVYVSAAEGFVLLAGYVLGAVSRGRARKEGLSAANRKLIERSFTLYKAFLVAAGFAALVTWVRPGWAAPIFDELPASLPRVLVAAATFHLEPPLLDVLALYVLCLAASPLFLWLLARGLTLPLLAGSIALWLLNQLHPYALCFSPLGREHPYFALPSWQLLYVAGFVGGYHASELKKYTSRVPRLAIVAVALPVVVLAAIIARYDVDLGVWPARVIDRARWLALTDRSLQGGARIVAMLGLFPLLLVIVDTFFRPLRAALGDFLLTLGQNSLYVFLLHVPLVVAWHFAPAVGRNAAGATIGQIAVLLLLWQLTKRRFLFNIIPR